MGGNQSKGSYGRFRSLFDNTDYKEAYKKDPDVKNFHDSLETDMTPLINSFENARVEDGLPLDSFKILICYLDILDKRLKNLTLANEKDIRESPKLKALVDQYNELHEETSKFYNGISNWAERVNRNQLKLKVALQHIEPANPPPGKKQYTKCMEKLREFKEALNLLDKDLSDLLDSVYLKHEQIREKLELERKKSAGKLKCMRAWRKFSNIFFAAAFVTVLVSSVVVAIMTAPPLAAVVAAAVPIGTIGEWVKYRLEKKEKKIKVENEVKQTMHNRIHGGLCELKQISARVKRLEDTIRSILDSIDFYCEDEDHQKVAAEHIRKKLPTVKKQIDKLKDPLENIRENRQNVEDAVETIQQKMEHLIRYVNCSDDRIQENYSQVALKNIG
ncbi:UPF0496 protein At4g34320-like [Cryptomeria japonica]|uniref:UPF0496 protein At4g34320-like n=1 Tax=Cryptomeria japonica TaxID=3369 RepID=UPI0027DA61EF|nr:UPF0496 protein At4g34320-like [Cryptomeria japonica]